MQWNIPSWSQPLIFATLIASCISSKFAIPVENKIGFFLLAIYFIKGKSTNSKDATLYAGVSKDSRRSTAVSSKGKKTE